MKNRDSWLRYALIVLLSCQVGRVGAVLPTDSVETYTNHTVTDSVFVQGRSTLTINDVNVLSGGHLVASSPNGIVIDSCLYVELGGKLSLYEKRVKHVSFTYDVTGNIIRRKEKWQAR